jgi:hypothetical protein
MTDAIRHLRRYLGTHDQLRNEIRPLPSLDPGTDREDYGCDVGGYIHSLMMAVNGVLAHSDDELEEELPDLRAIAEQLLARVEKLGG